MLYFIFMAISDIGFGLIVGTLLYNRGYKKGFYLGWNAAPGNEEKSQKGVYIDEISAMYSAQEILEKPTIR